MSGGFWAGSIPPWAWVLYVCAAGIFIILVLAASMSGRRRGYDAGYADGRADMLDQVKETGWRPPGPAVYTPPAYALEAAGKYVRGERTAAFLNPPELHHERQPMCVDEQVCCVCGDPKVVYHNYRDQPFCDPCSDGEPSRYVRPEVAHEAWLAHEELAVDLANDDPTVSAWTQAMAESMDAWLEAHVYSVPIPYLPGEEER
jgi:hypothetical protein